MDDKVIILLSTYNGEKFLKEQLDSLLKQDFSEWVCHIRDDGSKDKTCEIIKTYVDSYPLKFINKTTNENKGAAQSFLELLGTTENKENTYYMFCDQDDVWNANKISLCLKKMKQNETQKKGPVLIHTDLRIVDERLQTINNSMEEYMHLDFEKSAFCNLLIQNNITGCTMMINNDLKKQIIIREEIIMHDWWIALVASITGKIDYVKESTILYRQHNQNVVGATKNKSSLTIFSNIYKRLMLKSPFASYEERIVRVNRQNHAFLEEYKQFLDLNQRQLLNDFLMVSKKNLKEKTKWFISKNIEKQQKIDTLIWKFFWMIYN